MTAPAPLPRRAVLILLDSLNRHHIGCYGGRAFETPDILKRNAMPERIGRNVESKSVSAEFVREHVAGVAGIRPDLEKRRHRTDEGKVIPDDSRAADVFLAVDAHRALGFAQRGEVMELYLCALDR